MVVDRVQSTTVNNSAALKMRRRAAQEETGAMVVVDSVAVLIDIIEKWESKFFGDGKGYPAVWYRGQGDEGWAPLPGALRSNFIQAAKADDSLCLGSA